MQLTAGHVVRPTDREDPRRAHNGLTFRCSTTELRGNYFMLESPAEYSSSRQPFGSNQVVVPLSNSFEINASRLHEDIPI